MSLLLGRGAAAIGACARRGILRASAVRPGGGLVGPLIAPTTAAAPMPMIAMGAAAPAAIPLLMSVREFGKKKKKGDKREGLHKEVKHDAKAERRNKRRKKHASRMKKGELVDRARYAELEAEGGGNPPLIGLCGEKGPDSWECNYSGAPSADLLRTFREARIQISTRNLHLKDRWPRVMAALKDARYGYEDRQKEFEIWLSSSLQYESQIEYAKIDNDFKSGRSLSVFSWRGAQYGDSNFPTIQPGVSNVIQMPMTPSMVKNVKRGQMVVFLRYSKRMLAKTPESFRYTRYVCKRVTALEGDVVEFEGKKYTVPKDHIWVLGDNPSKSSDSRHFGAVPVQNIRARVLFTFQFDPFSFKSVTK